MKAACIIVTMGTRPAELARAVASVRSQTVPTELIVVANGPAAPDVEGATMVRLPTNLGPAGGRNRAVEATDADLLFFLDDDAAFAEQTVVARATELFRSQERLGIASFRIDDPDGRAPQRRHVPRIVVGDRTRSSDVTLFLEGACAIRRIVFEKAGLYPEQFFFDHEGIDLAWRAMDAGFRIRYVGDIAIHHPAEPPTRHGDFHYLTARNRVFLARRLLPLPVAAIYVAVWALIGLARAPSPHARKDLLRGFKDGRKAECGPRRPLHWRTIWRMTRLGRPPIL